MITIERIAHHEAAHAVVAYWQNVKLDSVSIVPDSEKDAYILISEDSNLNAKKNAIIAWAGPAADEIYMGAKIKDEKNELDRHIFKGKTHEYYVYRFKYKLLFSERMARREKLMLRVSKVLSKHWDAVEVLARALLERKELTGEEAFAIIATRWKR